MPDIRPVSDLRKDFKAIEKTIKETGGPIFLTSNGRPSMVIISNEKYDEMTGESSANVFHDAESLSRVLSGLRKAKELTTEALADKAGISQELYTAIEAGDKAPTEHELSNIAAVLGVEEKTLHFFAKKEVGRSASRFKNTLIEILETISKT